MVDDEVIRTTGLELTMLEDEKSVVLTFSSHDRPPVKLSVPTSVAAKLAQFISAKLVAADAPPDTPLH